MKKDRFEKQLAFILEADKEKNILRKLICAGVILLGIAIAII